MSDEPKDNLPPPEEGHEQADKAQGTPEKSPEGQTPSSRAVWGCFLIPVVVLFVGVIAVGAFITYINRSFDEMMEETDRQFAESRKSEEYDPAFRKEERLAYYQQLTHHHCPWVDRLTHDGEAIDHAALATESADTGYKSIAGLFDGLLLDTTTTLGIDWDSEDIRRTGPEFLSCTCIEDPTLTPFLVDQEFTVWGNDRIGKQEVFDIATKMDQRLRDAGYENIGDKPPRKPAGDFSSTYRLPQSQEAPLDVDLVDTSDNGRHMGLAVKPRPDVTEIQVYVHPIKVEVEINSACIVAGSERSKPPSNDDLLKELEIDPAELTDEIPQHPTETKK
ncbi:hypothetical protein [Corynebacterium aquilae]|uniref:Uncharacterized protein n=1 Tax=Corynebacterium aquilae DSM 44791 TaxID=1431546 RepID=A0A1L7CF44_9CORY|nr:hypothetical protein [Corynebacterium aquilae]APT84393.1 hypothetical protein CAQU_04140 [Corynebacterium aquilae DSM 44791]